MEGSRESVFQVRKEGGRLKNLEDSCGRSMVPDRRIGEGVRLKSPSTGRENGSQFQAGSRCSDSSLYCKRENGP